MPDKTPDPRFYHWSRSRNAVTPIGSMDEVHIYNAIIKEVRDWLESLETCDTVDELDTIFRNGPAVDIHVLCLLEEMKRRSK